MVGCRLVRGADGKKLPSPSRNKVGSPLAWIVAVMKRENSIEAYDNFRRASLSVAEAVRALEREGISLAGLCEACHERILQTSSAPDQARQDEVLLHAKQLQP